MSRVPASLDAKVRARARHCCEYCGLPAGSSFLPFEVEHIIPLKHQGETILSNLAFACMHCNRHKGVNVVGILYPGEIIVRLFHPRRDVWHEHFQMKSGVMFGKTRTGEVTIHVLNMNAPKQVLLRAVWLA